jgi:hypothetical protein
VDKESEKKDEDKKEVDKKEEAPKDSNLSHPQVKLNIK